MLPWKSEYVKLRVFERKVGVMLIRGGKQNKNDLPLLRLSPSFYITRCVHVRVLTCVCMHACVHTGIKEKGKYFI